MKKQIRILFCLVLVLALVLCVLTACNSGQEQDGNSNPEGNIPVIGGNDDDTSQGDDDDTNNKPAKHSIVFYVDSEEYYTISTAGNEEIELPSEPKKDGFDFDGWYLDKDQWNDPLTSNTYKNHALTEDIKVYAKLKLIPQLKFKLLENDCYEVIGVENRQADSILIPSTYNGKPVVSIGERAFLYCKKLTNLIISDGVTSIGPYAFSECGLTSVTIGGSVIEIGEEAFYGCVGLTSVTIPDSVTEIGESAFEACYRLVEVYNKSSLNITAGSEDYGYIAHYAKNVYTSAGESKLHTTSDGVIIYDDTTFVSYVGNETDIIIPDSVTSIGSGAFWGCSGLTSVTIPDSVTEIGEYAFFGCKGLTSMTIPAGVTSIAQGTFYECRGLTNVTIPDSVIEIGKYAFHDCSGLTSVTIPDSVIEIGEYAFYWCIGLKSVTIPDSVINIAQGAFYICRGLTSVTIGNGNIGRNAFWDCSELTSVTIGSSVTSIGNGAFSGCSGLTSVYYEGTDIGWANIDIDWNNGYFTSATRYYYSEEEPTYDGNYWHYVDGVVTVWAKVS